jgi:hypothetical protein
MAVLLQETLFGPPEAVATYGRDVRGRGDDLPVPSERERLWPDALIEELQEQGLGAEQAAALLERLYGDVPRRTRLKLDEVCRRLRCDRMLVLRHIHETGELAAINVGSGDVLPTWRVYRTSLIFFLARREFGEGVSSRTDVRQRDADLMTRAVARVLKNSNNQRGD